MFKNYPTFVYDIDSKNPIMIRDLYHKTSFYFQTYRQNLNVYESYIIKDGDTPEDVSFYFYDSYDYWYLILMLNSREDPFYDWPITNEEILNFAIKYVTEDYWEIQEQTEYTPDDPKDMLDPIVDGMIGRVFTQLEIENDAKRRIYLPPKKIIGKMHSGFLNITSEFERE